MGKIEINKEEVKEKISRFIIRLLKEAIIIIIISLIGTPITLWLMECFVNHFYGYTLY